MKREELLVNAKPILFNSEMVKAILEDRKTVTRRVIKLPKWVKEDDKELNTFYFSTNDRGDSGVIDMQGLINYLHLNPYQVGDILYVRETWNLVYDYDDDDQIIWDSERYVYYADNPMPFTHWITEDGDYLDQMPWKPSIHMPKEAARLFLKVTNVRVERLQDISEVQSISEGVTKLFDYMSKSEFEDWSKRTSQNKIQSEYGYRNYLWHGNFGNYGLGNKLSDAWDYQFSCYRNPIDSFSSLWNSIIALNDWDKYGWEANPYVWVIEFERVEVEV